MSVLLALLASSCATQPAPHLYLLASPAGSLTELQASGPTLQLQPVSIPDYLDTTDILIRIGPHEVKASSTGQWAERLSAGIGHALRADLARHLPDARIMFGPPINGSARQIVVTVDALDMAEDGHCTLVAHWVIGGRQGQGNFSASSAPQTADGSRVSTIFELVEKLSASIAGTSRAR